MPAKNEGSWYFGLFVAALSLKMLLFDSYISTDFEVHRNWLAITKTLPISKWYFESTSEWTLDYPPFFAWFEYFLSQFAFLFDENITNISQTAYSSLECKYFQRVTVLASELVLLSALYRFGKINNFTIQSKIISVLVFLSPGFIIVDSIHFQYNGFLFGILIWSINFALENMNILSGLFFAILLNFKHIFVYIAPAYFVYLLRVSLASKKGGISISSKAIARIAGLGIVVLGVFLISFGPFIYMGQINQVISRLFPFKRGLTHAYWACNFWALYTILDRALIGASKVLKLGWVENIDSLSSNTRGLVGNTTFGVLYEIQPQLTFALSFLAMVPCLIRVWRKPSPKNLLLAISECGLASFLFGWHVHEKAVLLFLIPKSLSLIDCTQKDLKIFFISAISGYFGLLPLLFTPQEFVIKYTVLALWILVSLLYRYEYKEKSIPIYSTLAFFEKAYILGFFLLFGYAEILHYVIFKSAMQFLPLAIISSYCAVGVLYTYILSFDIFG